MATRNVVVPSSHTEASYPVRCGCGFAATAGKHVIALTAAKRSGLLKNFGEFFENGAANLALESVKAPVL